MKKILHLPVLLATLFLLNTCASENGPCVVIHPRGGSEPVRITVELARTAGQRSMGLMYRKRLGKTRGMLFLFDRTRNHRFTMRNTAIPLDIIFIDSTRRIAGIIEDTKPYANGPFSIDRPSRYALEVNAGLCARNGIAPGDSVVFFNISGHDTHLQEASRHDVD